MAKARNKRFLADPALVSFGGPVKNDHDGDLPVAVVATNRRGGKGAKVGSSVGKPSHFAVCRRDRKGHCLPSEGGAAQAGADDLEGTSGRSARSAPASSPLPLAVVKEKAPGFGVVQKVVKKGVAGERVTPPPPGEHLRPDVHADHNRDGVSDQARVGVPAFSLPPPPKVPRLPNLTQRERAAERDFAEAFERDPEGKARQALQLFRDKAKPGEPIEFGTDDAKGLSPEWSHPDQNVRAQNRATLNLALHQTANAVTKRAFVQHLDTLKEGDEITVTVGGCGAGKGYGLKNVPEVKAVKNNSKAVWDSAGDQNATENPWIQQEAERRGLKVNYVYVHADPYESWADQGDPATGRPAKGVVARANKPDDGRMVDAKVFADSYAIGARNFKQFYDANNGKANTRFFFIDNTTAKPVAIPGIPDKDLRLDAKKLAKFAEDTILRGELPAEPRVKRGALSGRRVWPEES